MFLGLNFLHFDDLGFSIQCGKLAKDTHPQRSLRWAGKGVRGVTRRSQKRITSYFLGLKEGNVTLEHQQEVRTNPRGGTNGLSTVM